MTGGASIGQGFETVMAQVAPMRSASITALRVIHGQTERIAYGIGAHASRATVMTASRHARRRAQSTREGARHSRRTACRRRSPRSTSSAAR